MPPPLPKPRYPQNALPTENEIAASQRAGLAPGSRQSVHVYDGRSWKQAQSESHSNQRGMHRDDPCGHTGLEVHQELPTQPVPAQYGDPQRNFSQREVPPTRIDYDVHQPAARNDHGTQSFAQLSLQSPSRRRNQYDQPTFERRPVDHDYHRSRDDQAAFAAHRNSLYRATDHYHGHDARPQLQTFSRSYQDRRNTPVRRENKLRSTPAQQIAPQVPAGSVISPFFKRGPPASRPPTLQRPPTRGSYIRRQYASPTPEATTNYQMASVSSRAPQAFSERKTINVFSFVDNPHRSFDQRPSYQPTEYRSGTGNTVQQPSMISQTPCNSQGLLQRADRPPPSASYAPGRPQSNMYRKRVSLPLRAGPQMPMASNQDEALSQIQGVRGLNSQNGFPTHQRAPPNYGGPRPLFSSAGGRRSVRR